MTEKKSKRHSITKCIIRELIMFTVITTVSGYLFGSLYITIKSWETYRTSLYIASVFYVVMRLLPGLAAPWIIQKLLLKKFERSFKTIVIEILIFALSGLLGTWIVLVILSAVTHINFIGSGRTVYIQLFIGLGTTLMIIASIYAVVFYREMINKMMEAQQARELAVQAELKALRAQVNPHFLFNTLNSISSLIPVEPEKADRVTQKLADVFRYTLVASEKETVTLNEELQFISNYLEIEKIRFEERLTVETRVSPEAMPMNVPSLILQPIVENALKHGIGRNLTGGILTIAATIRDGVLQLIVRDNGDGFTVTDETKTGLGIGLANVDQRLKKMYGNGFGLSVAQAIPKGAEVILTLPAVRQEPISKDNMKA